MTEVVHPTLGAQAARQLANTTKTPPQWIGVTPRWLVSLLPWVPVEAGTYRVNKVKEGNDDDIRIECSPSDSDDIPSAFVDYEEQPREYTLSTVTTTIEVQTRISDLYRSPMDQVREQLGVLIEMVKERQENELINNANYGLLSHVAPSMRVKPRAGAPTPDDLDELICARCGRSPPSSSRTRGDRRVRPRVHVARRTAAHGHAVRLALPHVARHPARSRPTSCQGRRTARRTFSCFARARRSAALWVFSSLAFPVRRARACRCA